MQLTIDTNTKGFQEAHFGKNHDATTFYQFAARLQKILGIQYSKKYDYFNTMIWDYSYNSISYQLRYDWHEGIFIALASKDHSQPEEIAGFETMVALLERFN